MSGNDELTFDNSPRESVSGNSDQAPAPDIEHFDTDPIAAAFAPDALEQLSEIAESHRREEPERRAIQTYLSSTWSAVGVSWFSQIFCGPTIALIVDFFTILSLLRLRRLVNNTECLDADEIDRWDNNVKWLTIAIVFTVVSHILALAFVVSGAASSIRVLGS
ncbi:MAG: hypothetical protein JSS02_10190 [Planctomycetes bacterium]|nr:hypothetical protein [Planctomycetota bacterium]